SGIVYVPDPTTFLGIKASLYMGTHPRAEAFNGDATFEIAFNESGGINAISFTGNGYFITPPMLGDVSALKEKCKLISKATPGLNDNLDKASQKGQVCATVHVSYDVPNETLHGNLKVFVNVAGGVLKGIGPNALAGDAVLHFAPHEWYIYIGTPEQRIGVELLRMAKAESYLMVGTKLPGSPPPPSNVSDILGGIDLDYMRDLNKLGQGAGFAFGSSLNMNTGDLRFLMFYARFAAGLGFDIMLKNYGPDVYCAGRSGPLGINGWYANGQAYAYFQGKIGIVVDLMFYKGNFDIIDLGAAAILQAKLPNPVWMRGTVGGYFRILNGLVSGNCKFQVTLGEECQIVGGSVLGGIKVISEITPKASETDVNVFAAPQALFNMPVGKVFEVTDMDGKVKAFRIKLEKFKLTTGRTEIPGVIEWNEAQDVSAIKTYDILPSKTEVKVLVEVSFEERVSGTWRPVFSNGKLITEIKTESFTTGIAPDYIPASNIAYSYPVNNQFNFYKDETDAGYIKLKQGMPHLFIVSSEWKQVARFKSGEGSPVDIPFTYTDRQINFKIPADISLNKVYTFSLVNVPVASNKAVDSNVDDVQTQTETEDVTVKTKKASGTLQNLQEKEIYSYNFKTSKYPTFTAKLNAASISLGWRRQLFTGVHELGATVTGDELFDLAEIQGTMETAPLIQFEAVLTDNNWYGNYIHPLLYQEYPMNNQIFIQWRQTNTLGVPPAKAVYIRQYPNDRQLESQDITSGSAELGTREAAFVYDLNFYMYKDYQDMQGQAANIYANKPVTNNRIIYLLSTPYPIIKQGAYKVQIKYVMPGTGKINSIKEITINNPVSVSE
ncbi:MAG: hypothetical protein K2X86_06520, partial [Cytophagaceae bacterium]|nr:hypothetical protein [Cytophagaceae bacterium]